MASVKVRLFVGWYVRTLAAFIPSHALIAPIGISHGETQPLAKIELNKLVAAGYRPIQQRFANISKIGPCCRGSHDAASRGIRTEYLFSPKRKIRGSLAYDERGIEHDVARIHDRSRKRSAGIRAGRSVDRTSPAPLDFQISLRRDCSLLSQPDRAPARAQCGRRRFVYQTG
jgi:hypothetical protein